MSSGFEGRVGFHSGSKWSTRPNTSPGGECPVYVGGSTVQPDALGWPQQMFPSGWALTKCKLHTLYKFGNTSWRTVSALLAKLDKMSEPEECSLQPHSASSVAALHSVS